jgi:flagellar hook-basal body complex protein FliE
MTVDPISIVGAAAPPAAALPPLAPPASAAGFGDWFASELGAVNTSLVKAEQGVQRLAVGEATSLHDVMIHLEEAKLSFQLLAQVRNRLLDAYQEVMRMQV